MRCFSGQVFILILYLLKQCTALLQPRASMNEVLDDKALLQNEFIKRKSLIVSGWTAQWNLSIKDTLNNGHLSNEDSVCSPNHTELYTNLALN